MNHPFLSASRLALAALLFLGLQGCGSSSSDTPAIEQVAQLPAAEPYRLGPGDAIDVKHRLNAQLNEAVTILPDGQINLPGLSGSIPAAGRTPDELAHQLQSAYAEIVQQADTISVIVRQVASQQIFVGGEVVHPGAVAVTGQTNLLQSVFAAGGLTPLANTEQVVVLRYVASQQRYVAFAVDLDAVMKGNQLQSNVALQGHDIVVVPRSGIGDIDRFVQLYVKDAIPFSTSAGAFYDINPTHP
ncbi:MAG TPA: polysaccharide biosynthesis/export family protein [Stellaceae bacterium]|jgi:protein involved in polysaccharide export with SLBB domain|nr:polysaccharide biosynthesis/export family protein [Stellaceae bacterium]